MQGGHKWTNIICDWPLHGLEICKALTARGKKKRALILKNLIHNYRIVKMFYVQ